jgi:hypothetical protein
MSANQLATVWMNQDQITETCIGRMTNEAGKRIEIIETDWITDKTYEILVNGKTVTEPLESRDRAIRVANWWMDGCPA